MKASKVQMADIIVTKLVDMYSPMLFIKCATGQFTNEAKIRVDYGESWYMMMELEDVVVSSYSSIGESGVEAPKECFTLSYQKIIYTVHDGETTITHGWDLLKNKSLP